MHQKCELLFSLENRAEIDLIYLIPLWQPCLKYNQLFRVMCCQRAEDFQHGCLRMNYISWEPDPGSPHTMWHVVWYWPWENSYRHCTTDLRSVECPGGGGELSIQNVPFISLKGPHGKWPSLAYNLCGPAVSDRRICAGWRLTVSI